MTIFFWIVILVMFVGCFISFRDEIMSTRIVYSFVICCCLFLFVVLFTYIAGIKTIDTYEKVEYKELYSIIDNSSLEDQYTGLFFIQRGYIGEKYTYSYRVEYKNGTKIKNFEPDDIDYYFSTTEENETPQLIIHTIYNDDELTWFGKLFFKGVNDTESEKEYEFRIPDGSILDKYEIDMQ